MARISKAVSTAVKSAPGTSLANIDAELANEVATLKNAIGQSSGNKIKVEATGDFILPDGMNLGNEIQVVVVDFATHHDYYAGPYNPQNPEPPVCYARGKDLSTMVPEDDSPEKQNDRCATCQWNQFGSGQNGKSKACKNSRMLAVLVLDPDNPDSIDAADAPLYALQLPPTAIKSFDGAVAHVARSLNGPPIKAVFTVSAKNVGTYALISFSDPVPNASYAAHAARRGEAQDILYRKPDFAAYEAKQAAPARRAPRRPTAGARR
jgi:hypothetical protein